ncbi:MAG: hypothetical protein ICV78_19225 [Tolypothrix sp. Co-bin9]|nr:hypothetical protein [Tolypothrix sp. Co-bin9]
MKEQKVSIANQIQITPQPVVFMPSLTGIAVTALSVVATSLAVSTPEAATATETQTPQPVVFISQSRSFEVVTGEKLQHYETRACFQTITTTQWRRSLTLLYNLHQAFRIEWRCGEIV